MPTTKNERNDTVPSRKNEQNDRPHKCDCSGKMDCAHHKKNELICPDTVPTTEKNSTRPRTSTAEVMHLFLGNRQTQNSQQVHIARHEDFRSSDSFGPTGTEMDQNYGVHPQPKFLATSMSTSLSPLMSNPGKCLLYWIRRIIVGDDQMVPFQGVTKEALGAIQTIQIQPGTVGNVATH